MCITLHWTILDVINHSDDQMHNFNKSFPDFIHFLNTSDYELLQITLRHLQTSTTYKPTMQTLVYISDIYYKQKRAWTMGYSTQDFCSIWC